MSGHRGLDTQAAAAALRGPGTDTRQWVVNAVVNRVHFDPDHGQLADVTYIPQEAQHTVRVGLMYGGNGWGQYWPVQEGQNVLVLQPDGDPNADPTICCIISSPAHRPPTPDSETSGTYLRVEPGASHKIVVSGGGKVHLKVEGSGDIVLEIDGGKIQLGGEGLNELLDGLVHGRGIDTFTGTPYSALGNTSSKVLAKK